MARQLTKKQREFVKAYAEQGNGVKAVLAAYEVSSYESANSIAVENLQMASIRTAIDKAWRQINLTPERFASTISDAMEAETEMVVGPGVTRTRPDHNVRLKAVDLAARPSDAYPHEPAATHEHCHLHLESTEPIEVMRFRVIHGRAPTGRELRELIQPILPAPDTDQ
jgi:hypothetical protein